MADNMATQLMFNVKVKVEKCGDDTDGEGFDEEDNSSSPSHNQRVGENVTIASNSGQVEQETEIISIDDSDDENETSDSSNYNSKNMDICKYNQDGNVEEVPASSTSDSGNEKKYYIIQRGFQCTITKDTILKGIDEQSKLCVKKSDLYLNNAIRRYHPEKGKVTKSFHETLIDNAIEQWTIWYENCVSFRGTPLLYKCYLCNKGWWRLGPFREHITVHNNPKLNVFLEEVYHETNIVANIGPSIIKAVSVDSNCWRCNKPAKNHTVTKISSGGYNCERCQIPLYTCAALAQHESTCKPNLNIKLNNYVVAMSHGKLCTICCLYCPTQQKLDRHMYLYHTPRSDEPSYIRTKTCNMCNEKYHVQAYHDCPNQPKIYKCLTCFNKFISKIFLHLHMTMNKGLGTCPDCSKKYKECYLLQHMLQHSSNYDMLQYCLKCTNNVLYRSKKRFKDHMSVHGNAAQRRRWGAKMLLPLKCVKGEIVDSIDRLVVGDSEIYDRLDQLNVVGKSPSEIAAVIKNEKDTKAVTSSGNNSNPVSEEPDEIIESDYESDNYAFQVQLDAEIQRDIEIEAEISKVFKASNCYQKFLEKESKQPIDDDIYEDDVCILDEPTGIFVISDSDTEDDSKQIEGTSKPKEITESDKQKAFDSKRKRCEGPLTSNLNRSTESSFNANVTVKVESCDYIKEQSNTNSTNTENVRIDLLDNIKNEPVSKNTLEQNSQVSSNVEGSTVNANSNIAIEKLNVSNSQFNKTSAVKSVCKKEPNSNTSTGIRKVNQYPDIKIKEEIDCNDAKDKSVINFLKDVQQLDVDSDVKVEANSCINDGDDQNEIDLNENQEYEVEIISNWDVNERDEGNIDGTSNNKKRAVNKIKKRKYSETFNNNVDEVMLACKNCTYRGPCKQYIEHVAAKCPAKEITCTYCSKAFANMMLYLQHLTEHNLRYLACPECGKNFNIVAVLRDHIAKHICDLFMEISDEPNRDADSRIYVCQSCEDLVHTENFCSHWESHLDLNVVSNIKSEDGSDNEVELKSLMSPETVKNALDIIQSKPLKIKKCIVCSKYSPRKSDVKRHLIEHLLHEARVKSGNSTILCCPICQLDIEKVGDWRQHMREHAGLRVYRCVHCDKSFSDSSNYSKHRKVHNEFSYICDQCGGKFRARNSIIKHLVIHEQNPVSCSECQMMFYAESCLRKHIFKKHTPRSYLCGICRRRFSTLKERWHHMWVIHKQRKRAADCPICKKKYRRIIDVRYHMRLKHGVQKTDVNYKKVAYMEIQKGGNETEEEDRSSWSE